MANALVVFALVLLAYAPALRSGFIWDDQPGHVTRPELQSVAGLARIWLEIGATQQYYPLLHTAFWLEHRVWGDAPFGYHLLNVLWHATAACLVGALLRRLRVPGAGVAALIFALHPITVEPVAWVSEQKNTLSTVLCLCAALNYLRYLGVAGHTHDALPRSDAAPHRVSIFRRGSGAYWISFGFFLAALATKTVTATLPAVLLVIIWWRKGRLGWREDVLPLLPWFGFSVVGAVITSTVERTLIGAQGADFGLSAVDRVLLAGRAFWFYLSKLLWPADLAFIYPRWAIPTVDLWSYLFPLAATALLAVLVWRWRSVRGVVAVVLLYGGMLFPALGFVDVFPFIYSFVADHFQYLACIAIIALVAAGVANLPRSIRRATVPVLLAALGVMTWCQAGDYRDVFSLYSATLARNPDAWMAHNNLGIALVNTGRAAEALAHYEAALRLRPHYPEAENNLGYALNSLGRVADALPHLRRALGFQPNYAEAENNLGVAFMALGRTPEGIDAFRAAVKMNPHYAVAEVNLGLAVAGGGHTPEAIFHFARAVQLDPNYPEAELNWGVALTMSGRPLEALPHFERALDLRENYAPAHFYLSLALRDLGRFAAAERELRKAQELGFNPGR
jgi:protein O-mannosyl-transferase